MSEPRRDTGLPPLPDGPASTPSAPHAGGASGFPPPPEPPAGSPSFPHGRPDLSGAGGGTPHEPPPDIGWLGDVQGLARSARGMLQSRLLLLALELQRARHGVINLLVLLVIAAIAGATAWFALWAALIAVAVHLGLALPWACAGAAVINLLLLGWVVAAMKTLTPLLSLPASRRQFHWLFNDPRDQEDESADGRHAAPSA